MKLREKWYCRRRCQLYKFTSCNCLKYSRRDFWVGLRGSRRHASFAVSKICIIFSTQDNVCDPLKNLQKLRESVSFLPSMSIGFSFWGVPNDHLACVRSEQPPQNFYKICGGCFYSRIDFNNEKRRDDIFAMIWMRTVFPQHQEREARKLKSLACWWWH